MVEAIRLEGGRELGGYSGSQRRSFSLFDSAKTSLRSREVRGRAAADRQEPFRRQGSLG